MMIAARFARWRVPLGFACGVAVLFLASPTPRSMAAGGVIALVGEMLRIWSAGHLDKGREVTQSGPYRFTRHPLYLGSAIIALGVAVASGRLSVTLIIGVYMAIVVGSAVRHEEENMRQQFGRAYEAYLELPVTAGDRPFSFHRAMKVNKEYKAVLGLVAAALILALKVAILAD